MVLEVPPFKLDTAIVFPIEYLPLSRGQIFVVNITSAFLSRKICPYYGLLLLEKEERQTRFSLI
jgi:hypothetical protein